VRLGHVRQPWEEWGLHGYPCDEIVYAL
jgi:hypothetical protein